MGIAIIVCRIVTGFEFIHSRSFVHRDLTPANPLIDERGEFRIGDWQSSKLIENPNLWTGAFKGQYNVQHQSFKEILFTHRK
jgi:serine/threonine protein kinase